MAGRQRHGHCWLYRRYLDDVAVRDKLESYGGRRFVMSMGAGITATVLQWFGKIDAAGSTYALIVLGTVGAYIAGNTAQKIKTTNSSTDQ